MRGDGEGIRLLDLRFGVEVRDESLDSGFIVFGIGGSMSGSPLNTRGLRRAAVFWGVGLAFGEKAYEERFNLPLKLGMTGSELGRRFTSSSWSSSSIVGSVVKQFSEVWGKI